MSENAEYLRGKADGLREAASELAAKSGIGTWNVNAIMAHLRQLAQQAEDQVAPGPVQPEPEPLKAAAADE